MSQMEAAIHVWVREGGHEFSIFARLLTILLRVFGSVWVVFPQPKQRAQTISFREDQRTWGASTSNTRSLAHFSWTRLSISAMASRFANYSGREKVDTEATQLEREKIELTL